MRISGTVSTTYSRDLSTIRRQWMLTLFGYNSSMYCNLKSKYKKNVVCYHSNPVCQCTCDFLFPLNVDLFVKYNKAQMVVTKFICQLYWLEHILERSVNTQFMRDYHPRPFAPDCYVTRAGNQGYRLYLNIRRFSRKGGKTWRQTHVIF